MTNYLRLQSKQMNSSSSNKEYRILFLLGCILGAACFAFVYGIKILDFTYDSWLFNSDMDLKQHYIGFCHYRQSGWHFPIGLIDTLSFPNSMSVIYTDSIPIFAVIFKILSVFLPMKFQYFGLFGLMSFCLMGGLSAILLRRFVEDNYVCVIGSAFFVMSGPVLQRMYYHTALAAQWIIILALCLWLYQEEYSIWKRTLFWGLMGFLCVGIHSYYLPMAGMVLMAAVVDNWFADKKITLKSFLPLVSYCIFAIINLYILGGFYGSSSSVGAGLGTFNSNLNTFVNPIYGSKLINEFSLYNGFQYEGYAYLGAGMIFLVAEGIGMIIIRTLKKEWDYKKVIKEHYRIWLALGVFIVSVMSATLPMVTLNEKKLFGVPYPEPIFKLLSIFRSNGRFIWVAMYLLMIFGIVLTVKALDKNGGVRSERLLSIVIGVALVVQIFDMSGIYKDKLEYFNEEQYHDNFWDNLELTKRFPEYKGFVFLYNDNDILMDTAYYGYLNGMWQNNYYYARDINEEIDNYINVWNMELKSGKVRDDIIYVFKADNYEPEQYKGLDIYISDNHVIAVKSREK